MGILDDLLAGGQVQKEYKDFVNRYEQGDPSEGYSDQEVLKRYGEVSHAVPPDQYAQAAQEALGKPLETIGLHVKQLLEQLLLPARFLNRLHAHGFLVRSRLSFLPRLPQLDEPLRPKLPNPFTFLGIAHRRCYCLHRRPQQVAVLGNMNHDHDLATCLSKPL